MKQPLAKLDAFLESLSDVFNPLLVRETRQSLRGNTFAYSVVVGSSLFALALICGIFNQTFDQHAANQMKTGYYVFNFIFFALWFICCLMTPSAAAMKMRDEVSGGEFELFSVTGVSACSIVFGKLQATLVQTLLLCVLAAPFLMACLLLRGVSAPDILLCLGAMILYSTALTQIGMLIGCLRLSKVMHSIICMVFGGALGLLFVASISFIVNMRNESLQGEALGMVFLAPVLYGGLAFLAALATINLQNRNRALILKVALLLLVLLLPLPFKSLLPESKFLTYAWGLLAAPMLLACVLAPCARLAPFPRRSLSKFPALDLPARLLLHPGLGSTMLWLGFSILIVCLWDYLTPQEFARGWFPVLLATFSFWAFAGNMLGVFFKKQHPLAFSLAGLIAPSIAAALLAFTPYEDIALLLFPAGLPGKLHEWRMLGAGLNYATAWSVLLMAAGFFIFILREGKGPAPK